MRNRVILALDCVRAKAFRKYPLGIHGARKYHQAARLLVEPMNNAQGRIEAARTHSPKHSPSAVNQRIGVSLVICDAQHADRLVDDNNVAIHEHNGALLETAARKLRGAFIDQHRGTGWNARGRVEAPLTIHCDAPVGAQRTGA